MSNKDGNEIIPFGSGPNEPWNNVDQEVIREGCKLCLSRHREEAEALYDRTRIISRSHKLLVDSGESISYNAVRNHLVYHHSAIASNSLVKEYAEEVKKWSALQTDSRSALRRTMAMLEREMHTLAAQTEEMDLENRRKVSDTINKYANTLLAYRVKLEDLDRAQEPITIVFNQLQVLMEEEIKSLNDPKAKRAMANVIDKLSETCGDILVEVRD